MTHMYRNKIVCTPEYTVRDFCNGTYLILPAGRVPTGRDFLTIPHWDESVRHANASNGLKGPGFDLHSPGPPRRAT